MTNTPHPSARALSLLTLALFASPLALAQGTGWYGGANAGRTGAEIDDARITSGLLGQGFNTTSIQDRDRSNGFKLFGGYQLSPYFALEGGYFDLGKIGYTAHTVPEGTLNGEMRVNGVPTAFSGGALRLPPGESLLEIQVLAGPHAALLDNESTAALQKRGAQARICESHVVAAGEGVTPHPESASLRLIRRGCRMSCGR